MQKLQIQIRRVQTKIKHSMLEFKDFYKQNKNSKTKKVYISGKISGLSEYEYKKRFELAEYEVKYYAGFAPLQIINPCNIKPFLGRKTWLCFMISDVKELLKCDEIYMLKNWADSRGAKIELAISILTNKKIKLQ